MKRIIAILLCIAMLTALCGCTGGGAETTVPTTQPAPVAAEVYAEAAAKLADLQNAELVITYAEQLDLGADHFQTTSKETIVLLGIGTEAFCASVKETYFSGGVTISARETYQGGTVYSQLNSASYKAEMTAEEYMDRYLPLMLVDASLYGSVEQDENGVFTFADASALESWCDNPYAIFESATATAELGEDGLPCKYTYKAEFAQGAGDMRLTVTMEIKTPSVAEITAPADADRYLAIDEIDAPFLILMASGYMDQTGSVIATSSDVITSQAAGFAETLVTTTAAYGRDKEIIASFDTTHQFADMTTGSVDGDHLVEVYLDGVLTATEDGGKPQKMNLTGDQIQGAVDDELQYLIPDLSDVTGFTITVVGDTALIEYTFSDEFAENTESYYCQTYFGDPSLLRNLASETVVSQNGGYIGIDLTTGMPLSMSQNYVVTHTIDGDDFIFALSNQIGLQLGTKESYKTITGEDLPVEEPAEKATPVFYKVTGANGETMWLLGTIHVGDERTAFLPQEIYDAFNASDALALEFDSESYTNSLMEDEEAIQAYITAMLYTDGSTLEDHIADGELYDNTIKLLKATGNYANENVVLLTKPVFHEMTLQNYFLSNGYRVSGDFGVDFLLEDLAREQEKEILSVESGEFQMDMLSNLSEELQELMLKEIVEYGQFATIYGTQELFEMWCRGDEAELIAYLTEEADDSDMTEEEKALYEEYNNAVGTMRNEDMLAVAEGYLNSGKTVFYAVGLAHLLAEDGLVNTLRNAGYTVELVAYAG